MSVFSDRNPNLLFDMCGFEVRMTPKTNINPNEFELKEGNWSLVQKDTKTVTAYAYIQVQ